MLNSPIRTAPENYEENTLKIYVNRHFEDLRKLQRQTGIVSKFEDDLIFVIDFVEHTVPDPPGTLEELGIIATGSHLALKEESIVRGLHVLKSRMKLQIDSLGTVCQGQNKTAVLDPYIDRNQQIYWTVIHLKSDEKFIEFIRTHPTVVRTSKVAVDKPLIPASLFGHFPLVAVHYNRSINTFEEVSIPPSNTRIVTTEVLVDEPPK